VRGGFKTGRSSPEAMTGLLKRVERLEELVEGTVTYSFEERLQMLEAVMFEKGSEGTQQRRRTTTVQMWKPIKPSRTKVYPSDFHHHHGELHGMGSDLLFPKKEHQVPHWAYEGPSGPTHWGCLCEQYHLAEDGKVQSPVNLRSFQAEVDSRSLDFHYELCAASIINNGHSVQLDWNAGHIVFEGKKYSLVQFHFHTPAEHCIDGVSYPMEMHLVHQGSQGELAVIGVIFQEGPKTNPFLEEFWNLMPKDTNVKHDIPEFSPKPLLQMIADSDYFTYQGSLTTPPCSEGVTWIVINKIFTASVASIEQFRNLIPGGKNNRPMQPLNGRVIRNCTDLGAE